MPTYQFEAMDAKGQEIRDVVEAENEEAQTQIRDMGYFVTKIHVKKARKSADKKKSDGRKRGFTFGGIKSRGSLHVHATAVHSARNAGLPFFAA